jgi:hypothetical protein
VKTAALLTIVIALAPSLAAAQGGATEAETERSNIKTHYLRGAYQIGTVLPTNSFVKGEYPGGERIDSFQSLRLEFGWQTDGSRDWQNVYNFPSYGLGLYGATYTGGGDLGNPTSLYGFFTWPTARWSWATLNVELGFGLTTDWAPYDPESNPYNGAIGAGRTVHIDVGANLEFPLARHWALLAGFSGTHFSNGGTQQPNQGLNQIGPLLFVKYDFQGRFDPPPRREPAPWEKSWEMALTFAAGIRNLSSDAAIDDPEYFTKDFFVANATAVLNRRLTYMANVNVGLDFSYDETVPALKEIEAAKQGQNAETSSWDKLGLGVTAGYEHNVNDTRLLFHLGYTFLREDVEGQIPRFYQRLGIKHHVFGDWLFGLNVRFQYFGTADNLEWNIGRRFGVG